MVDQEASQRKAETAEERQLREIALVNELVADALQGLVKSTPEITLDGLLRGLLVTFNSVLEWGIRYRGLAPGDDARLFNMFANEMAAVSSALCLQPGAGSAGEHLWKRRIGGIA